MKSVFISARTSIIIAVSSFVLGMVLLYAGWFKIAPILLLVGVLASVMWAIASSADDVERAIQADELSE